MMIEKSLNGEVICTVHVNSGMLELDAMPHVEKYLLRAGDAVGVCGFTYRRVV